MLTAITGIVAIAYVANGKIIYNSFNNVKFFNENFSKINTKILDSAILVSIWNARERKLPMRLYCWFSWLSQALHRSTVWHHPQRHCNQAMGFKLLSHHNLLSYEKLLSYKLKMVDKYLFTGSQVNELYSIIEPLQCIRINNFFASNLFCFKSKNTHTSSNVSNVYVPKQKQAMLTTIGIHSLLHDIQYLFAIIQSQYPYGIWFCPQF